MATSTLIQRLDQSGLVTSTTVPGGYTVVTTPDVSNRTQKETFLAGAAITAGDWVAFDTTATGAAKVLTVVQASAVALGNPLVAGVALTAATAVGQKVEVCIAGYCPTANVNAAIVAGSPLVVDTTAGRADIAATGDIAMVGVALEADGVSPNPVNYAAVWVYKQF